MSTLHPFQFSALPVRGRLIRLPQLAQHIPTFADAPTHLQQSLAELLCTAALLAHDAKSQATVTIQLQHPALGILLFAQCNQQSQIRAYANPAGHTTPFAEAIATPGGILAVTFQMNDSDTPYQSLIPLTHPTLAACLADYFHTSVQTPTILHVSTSTHTAAALILQQLPSQTDLTDDWQRIQLLTHTLTPAELLPGGTDPETLLHQLFNTDDISLFPTQPLTFAPHAPRARMLTALASLPPAELTELLANGPIQLVDETTGHTETFTHTDLLPFLTQANA